MKKLIRAYWLSSLLLLAMAAAAPVTAQGILGGWTGTGRAPIQLSPYAGMVGFSALGEVEGRLVDALALSAPYLINNIEVSAEAAPVFGLAIGRAAGRWVDVRLRGGFSATELDLSGVVYRPIDGSFAALETVGGLASAYVSSVDLDILWRLRDRDERFAPYALLGAGVTIWDLNALNDFENIEPLTGVRLSRGPSTDVVPAGVIGVGADVRYRRGAALRIEVFDRIGMNALNDGDFGGNPDFIGVADASEIVHQYGLVLAVVISLGDRSG